jgi:hypothetical protein
MGAESTRYISRAKALAILYASLPAMSDESLERLLDYLARSDSGVVSRLDRFNVGADDRDDHCF